MYTIIWLFIWSNFGGVICLANMPFLTENPAQDCVHEIYFSKVGSKVIQIMPTNMNNYVSNPSFFCRLHVMECRRFFGYSYRVTLEVLFVLQICPFWLKIVYEDGVHEIYFSKWAAVYADKYEQLRLKAMFFCRLHSVEWFGSWAIHME